MEFLSSKFFSVLRYSKLFLCYDYITLFRQEKAIFISLLQFHTTEDLNSIFPYSDSGFELMTDKGLIPE